MFTSTGKLTFDKNWECRNKDEISKCWFSAIRYPKSERTIVKDGTTYLFCIVECRERIAAHFWAVYPGIGNPEAAKDLTPEYLTQNDPNQKEEVSA